MNILPVVGSYVAPNKRSSQKYLILFQILVTLVTISDWPWWVSWLHFYSQSLPTKKLQATLPISLPCGHATPTNIHSQFFCFDGFQKNRYMRKELKSSDLCLRLKSTALPFSLTDILPISARPTLSTSLWKNNACNLCLHQLLLWMLSSSNFSVHQMLSRST